MSHSVKLNHLTKVEGHATLTLKIEDNQVQECQLSAVEGSRYFEALLKGKHYYEAQEISTRICGICSTAHNIAAIHAIENALDVKPSMQTMLLRELQTLAERIRSHTTHIYFLALPDYLGYESALAMTDKYKPQIADALALMKVGNDMLVDLVGRDLHPISATIGGYLKLPTQESINAIKKKLASVKPQAKRTAELFLSLKYPQFERRTQYISLVREGNFATMYGDVKTPEHTYTQNELHTFIVEHHNQDNTSNFAVHENKEYLTGALARINNNQEYLSKDAQEAIKKGNVQFPSTNPYHNNAAQAVEVIHYIDRAIEICTQLKIKDEELVKPILKKGHGIACVEVPRGMLWHEYEVDEKGIITRANIMTPTVQNLRNMQEDIKALLPDLLKQGAKEDTIVLEVEKLIRSYDPCFSCSTHFLKVNWL